MARVLVVDDVAVNRELVVTLLRYAGHELVEAANGEEALAQARAFRPDLVVCDILMPTMDGYEFVRRLRSDPAIAHTEIVFYTATFLEEEARVLAAACGVRHVLSSPASPSGSSPPCRRRWRTTARRRRWQPLRPVSNATTCGW